MGGKPRAEMLKACQAEARRKVTTFHVNEVMSEVLLEPIKAR
jgi:hypothetical protein